MVELDKRIVLCRDCQQEVSSQARTCPHCGASYPANQDWSGSGFEWKSNATIYGYPLIHIAFGRDKEGKVRVARGIIAIGQFGIGLITFAQFGIGILFGFGQFVVGFVCIAQFAGGILFGLGQ
ncbi:MAG: zinc ribbon domain-containing protein, partial [candidate division WOR-3 bacterium]